MTLPDLFILAGGRGSRMGGDKLRLRDSGGRLLVERWADRVAWPTPPVLVLPPGGSTPDELADWPRTYDATSGDGPLRGVEAALRVTRNPWCLVVAVDTPGIGREQLEWMAGQRDSEAMTRLWMTRRQDEIEPFPLLIHRDMTNAVTRRLDERRRALHGLADEPQARVVDVPDWPAETWMNLNRPEELARYLGDPSIG